MSLCINNIHVHPTPLLPDTWENNFPWYCSQSELSQLLANKNTDIISIQWFFPWETWTLLVRKWFIWHLAALIPSFPCYSCWTPDVPMGCWLDSFFWVSEKTWASLTSPKLDLRSVCVNAHAPLPVIACLRAHNHHLSSHVSHTLSLSFPFPSLPMFNLLPNPIDFTF